MSRRLWRVLFRAVLLSYPASFRRRFGRDLERTLDDRLRGKRAEGGARAEVVEGFGAVVDLSVGAVGEWVRTIPWGRGDGMVRRERAGGRTVFDGWWVDGRHAARALRKRPGLASIAILTLALGVGANAAIFTVVNAVLLGPFDVVDVDEVVLVQDRSARTGSVYETTGGAYLDWVAGNRTFESLGLFGGWALNLTDPGQPPERALGAQVSASYFDVLGVAPALGRVFRAEENQGQHHVVVLSDALWRGRYGADPDIIGRTIDVNGTGWEIIGVMPPVALPMKWGRLDMPEGAHERLAWVPVNFETSWVSGHRSHVYMVVGRLASGVSVDVARADLEGLAPAMSAAHPDYYTDVLPDVRGLRDALVGGVRRDLLVLLGAVGLVLLVACANLTNLLLARSIDRERELAVRAAVGARAGRLVRLGLLEGGLLGLAAGAGALVVAALGMGVLSALVPADLPRVALIALDARVIGFTLALALGAGLLAGLIPALRGGRPRLGRALRAGGRGGDAASGNRSARVLVSAQLALACTLMVGAGLMGRSFIALRSVELGANTERTLVADLLLGEPTGPAPQVVEKFRLLEERLEALAGVEDVAIAYDPPTSGSWTESFTVIDRPPPETGSTPGSWFRPVSPGYFDQFSIPVVRGRGFVEADDLSGSPVVVVNEAFVRQWFPDEDRVVGRRLRCSCGQSVWGEDAFQEWEIVGVVADVRFAGLRGPTTAAMYYSIRQAPTGFVRLMVRTLGEPTAAEAEIREAVTAHDPRLPLADVRVLDEELARITAQDRFNALLLGLFALVALLVAAAGVYGVLAYAVARRTRELGVRQALGADPGEVLRMLLGEGLRMAGAGLLLGAIGAVGAGRVLAGFLFGVRPWDPAVLLAVVVCLGCVSLFSGWVPARRAARIDPSVALKGE